MAKYKLEYIWLDGYEPVANLRGKTQVKEFASFPKLEELPIKAKPASDRGQNLDQNTRNPGYQQDR